MIISIAPKLPFIDKKISLQYFVDQLGCELRADYDDYLILALDRVEFHLFSFPSLTPEKSDFMVYLRIDKGIEEFYQQIQKAGINIHQNGKLELKAWKQMEFAITDPAGTLFTFGQQVI